MPPYDLSPDSTVSNRWVLIDWLPNDGGEAAPGSTFTIRKGSSLPTSRPGGSCQRRVRLRRECQPSLSQRRQEPLYDPAGLEGLPPSGGRVALASTRTPPRGLSGRLT